MTRHPVFEHFEPWSGKVEAGWTVNFLGVATRQEFFAGMTGVVPSESGWVETEHPAYNEEYLEWIDVLEAVAGADGTFTMIELGAGWGRWLMNGAAAARAHGRLRLQLVGVEAEPTHFRWMQQHFADNLVEDQTLTLIEAAVAAEEGRVRFQIGDASAWYGQQIVVSTPHASARATARSRIRTLLRRRAHAEPASAATANVRAVTLTSILDRLECVDLIDLDVQGIEADVLESTERALAKVKRVHIGTHSADNEQRLRALFDGLGWENLNDYACGAEAETPWGPITFEDGVQTWVNPAP